MLGLFVVVGSSVAAAATGSSTVFVEIPTVIAVAVAARAAAQSSAWHQLVSAMNSQRCCVAAAVELPRKVPKERHCTEAALVVQVLPDWVYNHKNLAVDHSPAQVAVVQQSRAGIEEAVAAWEEAAAYKDLVDTLA